MTQRNTSPRPQSLRVGGLCLLFASLLFALGCPPSPAPDPTEISCDDGVRNGSETDIDCGGSCGACDNGGGCVTGADCLDNVCIAGSCREATCEDGVVNAYETDIDCGGLDCAQCDVGDSCDSTLDCAEGACLDGTCQPATCSDGLRNGQESDVDCGGPECGTCDVGASCAARSDCGDAVCHDQICKEALSISGIAHTEDPVWQFAAQDMIRVDFALEPSVRDFDGSVITLPTSPTGEYTAGGISEGFEGAVVTVNGMEVTIPTGSTSYQTIDNWGYYGVLIHVAGEAAAWASYDALVAQSLYGQPVEILVIAPPAS